MTRHEAHNEAVRDQFTKQAEPYAKLTTTLARSSRGDSALFEARRPLSTDNVLDVACGTGSLTLALARLTRHVTALAVHDLCPDPDKVDAGGDTRNLLSESRRHWGASPSRCSLSTMASKHLILKSREAPYTRPGRRTLMSENGERDVRLRLASRTPESIENLHERVRQQGDRVAGWPTQARRQWRGTGGYPMEGRQSPSCSPG
jgi:hypothetical protein